MSSIQWSGNRLIQRVRDHEEELGQVCLGPDSKSYVLWLKDTFGVVTTAGAHICGGEYPSKAEALDSPSVFIWHRIWMRPIVKPEAEQELDNRWEEISAATKAATGRERLRDRFRAYLDRFPSEKIQDLFQKIQNLFQKMAKVALTQWVIELVKRLGDGD